MTSPFKFFKQDDCKLKSIKNKISPFRARTLFMGWLNINYKEAFHIHSGLGGQVFFSCWTDNDPSEVAYWTFIFHFRLTRKINYLYGLPPQVVSLQK